MNKQLSNLLRGLLTPGKLLPIATALVAFSANILNIFGILKFTIAESLILLVMGLLAIESLTEKIQVLTRIEEALKQIMTPRSILDDITFEHDNLPPLREHLQGIRELWISGISLTRFLHKNELILLDLANQKNLKIRFLVLPVDTPYLSELAYMSHGRDKFRIERTKQDIEQTLTILGSFLDQVPSGQVEVKLLNNCPTQSLVIYNGHSDNAEVQIYLYSHQGDSPGVFRIKTSTNSKWQKLFIAEFLYLWENAKDFSPSQSLP